MFNNADITSVNNTNILEYTLFDFQQVINVSFVGVFLGKKRAPRIMIPAKRGSIINTTSVCGSICGVASHAYTSSKNILGCVKAYFKQGIPPI